MVKSPARPTKKSPVPPVPVPFTPVPEILAAGAVLYRTHNDQRKVNEFNPGIGNGTRFAFFGTPVVPVLYAAEDDEAAVCESIFHEIPADGGVAFPRYYRDRETSALQTTRDLKLASFKGKGLRGLGLEAGQITTCEAIWYEDTVKYAEAAYNAGFDGCVWMSRRLTDRKAYVIFDQPDGVLEPYPAAGSRTYKSGPGLDWLIRLGREIRIDIDL